MLIIIKLLLKRNILKAPTGTAEHKGVETELLAQLAYSDYLW